MTQFFPRQTVYGTVAQVLTATGDKLVFDPGRPVVVTDWGVILTTTSTGTSGALTCNLRPTAGSTASQTVGATSSSTGPVGQSIITDTAGGKMTLAPTAAGLVLAHKVSPAPAITASGNGFTGSTSNQGLSVNPGQEVALNLGTAMGTAGAGTPYITYYEQPEAGDSTAAGSQNALANVTFVNG